MDGDAEEGEWVGGQAMRGDEEEVDVKVPVEAGVDGEFGGEAAKLEGF